MFRGYRKWPVAWNELIQRFPLQNTIATENVLNTFVFQKNVNLFKTKLILNKLLWCLGIDNFLQLHFSEPDLFVSQSWWVREFQCAENSYQCFSLNKASSAFLWQIKSLYKSSPPHVFCKQGVLRNFAKFTEKHLCQSLFFKGTLMQIWKSLYMFVFK